MSHAHIELKRILANLNLLLYGVVVVGFIVSSSIRRWFILHNKKDVMIK